MNESYITVHGYVAAAPVIRKVGEHDVANFRIGVTPRKLERSSGEWRDAETQWYAVSAWRTLGANVARSLRKGDPVIVQGRLTARTWVNAQHVEVVAHDIEATLVGHDLRRGVTTFAKTATQAPAEPGQAQPLAPTESSQEAPPAPIQAAQQETQQETQQEMQQEPVTRADWSGSLREPSDWAGAA